MNGTPDSPLNQRSPRPTNRISRRAFLAGAAATTAAALTGLSACALDPANPANRAAGQIRVGSAMFPESEIIARIWAHALTEAGHDVDDFEQAVSFGFRGFEYDAAEGRCQG